MPETLPAIPVRFLPAYRCIQRLERDDRYLAAFIFGSVARGEVTEDSDLDVHVITNEDNPCTNVNHPFIGEWRMHAVMETNPSPQQILWFTSRVNPRNSARESSSILRAIPLLVASLLSSLPATIPLPISPAELTA